MWSIIILGLLAGACSADYGWKAGNRYNYGVRGRTFTGIHQMADQYAGVLMKANLTVIPITDHRISLTVSDSSFAEVHANLSNGWSTYIPDDQLRYQQLVISNKPFELTFKDGVVDKIFVEENLPTWQINFVKSIASQLQVDSSGKNLEKSSLNNLPNDDNPTGVYKTIEDSVTGKCETTYDVSPLALYLLQSKPELAPLPNLRGSGHILDIFKTQNYSDCHQRMSYNFGITGMTRWGIGSNMMGRFMSRSNIVRVVISGTLREFTIQSSVATNKIVLSPHVYNEQKGMVVSRMNITLQSLEPTSSKPEKLTNPRTIDNLVYEYNPADHGQNEGGSQTQKPIYREHKFSSESKSSEDSSSSLSLSSSSSSSSSSSEDGNTEKDLGQGKNKGLKKNASMKKKKGDSDSSSSSSSMSEEYLQPKPSLEAPAKSPFLSYFVGYEGNSIQASQQIDTVSAVKKLIVEMTAEFQNPNSITGQHTLTKFNIMTRIIRTMNAKQIEELANELYISPNDRSDSIQNYYFWVLFRDAIGQAGTGPALIALKTWIQEEKVTGKEAAELVMVLPDAARYPTDEYLEAFFELVTSPTVKKQAHLNSTAVLAFTDLLRRSRVSYSSMHNRYPTHSFGHLITKNNSATLGKYIYYLADEFQKSVEEGFSPKIQVYVRAIGNVAHPSIIPIFEPYLDGKKHISHFQRFVMVASLDRLTKSNPKLALSVLYNVYQNAKEKAEVRIAAVMHIMKANPPAQILQRMAEYTHYDPSLQVSSAVKSAIETAAQLDSPQSQQLSQNAQAAVNLLSPKAYRYHFSKHYIRAYVVKHQNLGYKQDFTYIQGKDNIIPSSFFYYLRRQMGGYKLPYKQVSMMTSSSDDLFNLISNQFTNDYWPEDKSHQEMKQESSEPGKWSSATIAKMLNIETDAPEQLEGNFAFGTFYSFDNHTIEQIPKHFREFAKYFGDSKTFNYTKAYNQFSMTIGLPTVTGLPFIYSINIPTFVYYGGNLQAVSNPDIGQGKGGPILIPDTLNITADFNFLYTLKTQSKLGFVTPYNHQRYIAGLEKNTHVNIPIRFQGAIDLKNKGAYARFESLRTDEDAKLFEYSTTAYTTMYDIFDLTPPLSNQETRQIHVRPVKRSETRFGVESTGFAFDAKFESEQEFIDKANVMNAVKRHDLVSGWLFPYAEKTINNNNLTVVFNPTASTSKSAFFNLSLDVFRNEKASEVWSQNFDNSAKSDSKRKVKKSNEDVTSSIDDINNRTLFVFDAGVEFEGRNSFVYSSKLGYASSVVSPKSRVFLSYSSSPAGETRSQMNARLDVTMPKTPKMNFKETLKTDRTTQVIASFDTGEDKLVSIQGTMKKSQQRQNYVWESSIGQLCERQIQQGDYILPACTNSTIQAAIIDQFQFNFSYEKIPEYIKDLSYRFYKCVGYIGHDYLTEKSASFEEGKMEARLNFGVDLRAMNASIEAPQLSAELRNVRAEKWAQFTNPMYDTLYHFTEKIAGGQIAGHCSLDQNMAVTLDNKIYPVNLGQCWYVLLQSVPKSYMPDVADNQETISVLARDIADKQREVKILLGEKRIELSPVNSDSNIFKSGVTVDGEPLNLKADTIGEIYNQKGEPIAQVWYSFGELTVYSYSYGFELLYDGSRLQLDVANKHRGQVYGLCGTFTGEPLTDFTVPKNCVVQDPFYFATSYAVDGACEGTDSEGAKEAVCYREDDLSSQPTGSPVQGQRVKSCTETKYQVMHEKGNICFSNKRLMTCSPNCKPTQTTTKQVSFFCVPESSTTRYWLKMVKNNENPGFSHMRANRKFTVNLPTTCSPK